MDKDIITYSRSVSINLTSICQNKCDYCDFSSSDVLGSNVEMAIPYSAVSLSKEAKLDGVKEITLVSGERPDIFAAVRSKLDLWGFSSFIEYIYTIAELCFLEGLVPHLDVGYLAKEEITIIRRITTSITMMLETTDKKLLAKLHKNSPQKSLKSRLNVIKWAAEGKLPVTTGIIVGMGETQKSRKEAFELIRDMHLKLGNIQNVILKNYQPASGILNIKKGPDKKTMLSTTELARKILPEDVVITVPAMENKDVISFIRAGAGDLGSFEFSDNKEVNKKNREGFKDAEKKVSARGLKLQRRLPIFSKYILDNWYSRKLAQMLDKYKNLLQQSEEKERV